MLINLIVLLLLKSINPFIITNLSNIGLSFHPPSTSPHKLNHVYTIISSRYSSYLYSITSKGGKLGVKHVNLVPKPRSTKKEIRLVERRRIGGVVKQRLIV